MFSPPFIYKVLNGDIACSCCFYVSTYLRLILHVFISIMSFFESLLCSLKLILRLKLYIKKMLYFQVNRSIEAKQTEFQPFSLVWCHYLKNWKSNEIDIDSVSFVIYFNWKLNQMLYPTYQTMCLGLCLKRKTYCHSFFPAYELLICPILFYFFKILFARIL